MTAEPRSTPLPHPDGPLAGYRVLDLADEKGQLCGRLLAELGADVIKVEPREGDRTRQNGPFYRGDRGSEHSLYWWAMNAGKRSVTCELRIEAGRELFHRLVVASDLVLETTAPSQTKALGLDYAALAAVNPAAIIVSITNFGQAGPNRDWLANDIVGSAMGGHMHLNGDAERGPVRTTAPQAFVQANVQAGVGAMTALYARGVTGGLGQHVDVSMQEAVANAMDNAQATWDILGVNLAGPGVRRSRNGGVGPQYVYEASDGWIAAYNAIYGRSAAGAIDWLAETGEDGGLANPEVRERLSDSRTLLPEELRNWTERVLAAFCRTRKRLDLVLEAQRRGLGWAPVFGPRDIVESEQLAARDYWVRVHHEDLGESFVYPGAPFLLSATPWKQRGRAPHAGEHNEQVYGDLLGIEPSHVRTLRLRRVI